MPTMINAEGQRVLISNEELIARLNTLVRENAALQKDNAKLKDLLNYERAQRIMAEQRIAELELAAQKTTRRHKTREEKEADAVRAMSKYKTNGVKKAEAVSEIRSYTDLKRIEEYLLSHGGAEGPRNWLMLVLGVCMGCRISDIVDLRFCQFYDDDMNFRERVVVYEKKTSKVNNCLITDAIKSAFHKYFELTGRAFEFDAYIFSSKKGGHVLPRSGWEMMNRAQQALGLGYNIGSHTLRKTFANIVACVDKTTVDMGTIEKVQGLLNHSDSRVTLRYMGALQRAYDSARISVSDFVLGKTGIDELEIVGGHTVNDVYEALETLSARLDIKKEAEDGT